MLGVLGVGFRVWDFGLKVEVLESSSNTPKVSCYDRNRNIQHQGGGGS